MPQPRRPRRGPKSDRRRALELLAGRDADGEGLGGKVTSVVRDLLVHCELHLR